MSPKIIKEECLGCGMCEDICPKVFKVSDDGYAENIMGEVPGNLEDLVDEAKENCPIAAISKSGIIKTVKVDKDKCLGCGVCEDYCPMAFKIDEDGYAKVNFEKVTDDDLEGAMIAKDCCPGDAISIE